MKNLAIIAAAAVIAGLLVYALLEWRNLIALQIGGQVVVEIPVFVGILAVSGLLSSTLALLMRSSIRRADERVVRQLEERLERLELGHEPKNQEGQRSA